MTQTAEQYQAEMDKADRDLAYLGTAVVFIDADGAHYVPPERWGSVFDSKAVSDRVSEEVSKT